MGVTCEAVWRDSSDYLDGSLNPEQQLALEQHIQSCPHCAAVMAGLRNVVTLYGDERMVELPEGFSRRLQQRIEARKPATRRSFFGWAVAFAASLLVGGAIELSRYQARHESEAPPIAHHEKKPVPPDLPVLVAEAVIANAPKLFHVAGCPLILDPKAMRKTIAEEALREGYTPCPRCLSQYL